MVIGASVQLHAGWKVGVVGANGSGKSSLFALLAGELHAEAGAVDLPASWRIARVAQETPALPDSAIDFVLDGDVELRRVERELAAAEVDGDGEAIGHLHARYGEIDGYSAKARVAEVLHGLGFADTDFRRPVSEFSGGWRVRLNLARALSCRADLLLLDEPTNHLDLEMREALALALQDYEGAMVLVSHDRHLLRTSADVLMLVDAGVVRPFDGDLDDYRDWLSRRRREQETQDETPPGPSRREQRRQEAQARTLAAAQRRPLERALRTLESELEQLSQRKQGIESRLADPNLYAPESREPLKAALLEQSQVNARLQEVEEQWLTLQTQLEGL
ncbi:MAG: ABC-F family ATP-binding cassette domain-containing protein [Burkholderiales bacterium]|nr:ABC-F family ATP-binding cassette domain-containing protein [Burkholderiales bacterium]